MKVELIKNEKTPEIKAGDVVAHSEQYVYLIIYIQLQGWALMNFKGETTCFGFIKNKEEFIKLLKEEGAYTLYPQSEFSLKLVKKDGNN